MTDLTDDMKTPGDDSDDYTLHVLTPDKKIALLMAEIARLKAENATMRNAIEWADAEGFEWASDPFQEEDR